MERSWRRIIHPASPGRAVLWIGAAVLIFLVIYAVLLWWLIASAFVLQLVIWVAYRLMSELPDEGDPSSSQKRVDAFWGYLKYTYIAVIVLGLLARMVWDAAR